MRVFVYEFVTAGSWWHVTTALPPVSLSTEGRAMWQALVTDFLALSDCEVVSMYDSRLGHSLLKNEKLELHEVTNPLSEERIFSSLVRESQAVVLIAPEFNNHLLRRAQLVESIGTKLLSPSAEFIGLTGDKWCTHLRMWKGNVAVPHTIIVPRVMSLPSYLVYPLVLKPVDGCGSQGVQLLHGKNQSIDWRDILSDDVLAQEYCPGLPVSIAAICGPESCAWLPACRQMQSADGRFQYLGGELPLSAEQDARAKNLAQAALAILPKTQGYVGFDIVLGATDAEDRLIEINPRLTTSYLGVRALAKNNLAKVMLDQSAGKTSTLSYRKGRVLFQPNGTVKTT